LCRWASTGIIIRALKGDTLEMTSGRQTREFNYVEDLAEGFLAAATVPDIEGEIINLGCGEEVSVRELAATILDLLGNPVTAEFGAIEHRPTEIWRMYGDSTKARTMLGWKPSHSLAEGLEKTIAWYRNELATGSSSFVV
jgi:UDP-glucose 4-epimerase